MKNYLNYEELSKLDDSIYKFLHKNIDFFPLRFVKFIAFFYTDARIRKLYYKKLGIVMGDGTYPNLGLTIVPNENVICVNIGDHVSIAPNVTFVCHSSANNGVEINLIPYVRDKLDIEGNIVVEDEVWIGANVTILPNVIIGRCSVIGAGSVVTTDVEPNSVYAGSPARKIRDLKTGERV